MDSVDARNGRARPLFKGFAGVAATVGVKKRLDVDLRASGDWECHRAVRGRTCPDMRLTERCTASLNGAQRDVPLLHKRTESLNS